MLHPTLRSLEIKWLGAVALALVAGCAGSSTAIPTQTTLAAPNALQSLGITTGISDAKAPPKCKHQKTTKEYAEVATEDMKVAGGSLCIPSFGGWGGAIQYPGTHSSTKYAVELITSTKAYKGSLLPPAGSQKAIFFLQYYFNGFPGFYPTLPKGKPLVSSHLVPKKSYTVGLWVYYYALGWSGEVSCYQVAGKSKYGGSLADVGAVFENLTLGEPKGAIEVFSGQLSSTKC
jgi:hypothetical protein